MWSKWTRLVHGHEDLLLPPSTCASASCNGWEGLHQPCTKLRDFSLPRICYQAKDSLSLHVGYSTGQPGTSLVSSLQPSRASWMGLAEHPFSHCSPSKVVTMASTESLPKEDHRARPHFVILGCKFTLSKNVQIPLKTQRKDSWKLLAAEWLQSEDSSVYKGGKISFTTSLGISPTQGWALGSGNFMFHRQALKSPARKWPPCKN